MKNALLILQALGLSICLIIIFNTKGSPNNPNENSFSRVAIDGGTNIPPLNSTSHQGDQLINQDFVIVSKNDLHSLLEDIYQRRQIDQLPHTRSTTSIIAQTPNRQIVGQPSITKENLIDSANVKLNDLVSMTSIETSELNSFYMTLAQLEKTERLPFYRELSEAVTTGKIIISD